MGSFGGVSGNLWGAEGHLEGWGPFEGRGATYGARMPHLRAIWGWRVGPTSVQGAWGQLGGLGSPKKGPKHGPKIIKNGQKVTKKASNNFT